MSISSNLTNICSQKKIQTKGKTLLLERISQKELQLTHQHALGVSEDS